MYFNKKSIAIKEDKKVESNPIKSGRNGNVETWFIELKNSTRATNEIAGIPSRKENIAASLLSQPDKSAIEIVAPERDTPGRIAKAWAIPINKLFIYLWLLILMNLLVENSAKSIIKDINKDTIPIKRFERKNEYENPGTNNFIITPAKAIGIVPIKIDLYNLFEKRNL